MYVNTIQHKDLELQKMTVLPNPVMSYILHISYSELLFNVLSKHHANTKGSIHSF